MEEMLVEGRRRETEDPQERGFHDMSPRGRPDPTFAEITEDAPFIPIKRTSRTSKSKRKENMPEKADMKKMRTEGDAHVVDPPYLILKGLPRVRRPGGKWEIPGDAGNPALTTALASFKDQLANTVKVVYSHQGAFGDGEGNCGVAIAKFKDYKEAEAASRAFAAAGRGRMDWAGVRALPRRGRRGEKTELFGWLAEAPDMNLLPKRGLEFKWRTRPLKEVLDRHQERLKEVEALQASVEEAERASKLFESDMAKLEKAKADFDEKITEIDKQTQEAEMDHNKIQMERDELQTAEKEKMVKAEEDHEAKMASLNRDVEVVREKRIKTDADKRRARECMFKKRMYEDQMRKRREELKGLEKLLQEQQELYAEWVEKKRRQEELVRNQTKVLKVKQEELHENNHQLASLVDKEKKSSEKKETQEVDARRKASLKNIMDEPGDGCIICLEPFRKPEPSESDPECKECRHLLVPCGHRNMCGGCCDDTSADAKKKKKAHSCPTCREDIQSWILLRVKI
ncbi:hypothetical protein BSKO_01379 [Bryopsis sp. KO-2023]|nr:hypothetical protein BSKO_01379 [Bryopsis sp. KO-2023]